MEESNVFELKLKKLTEDVERLEGELRKTQERLELTIASLAKEPWKKRGGF